MTNGAKALKKIIEGSLDDNLILSDRVLMNVIQEFGEILEQ